MKSHIIFYALAICSTENKLDQQKYSVKIVVNNFMMNNLCAGNPQLKEKLIITK